MTVTTAISTISGRTHHYSTFSARELTAEKQAQRTTISVVIPALNEAPTIANVVASLRSSLVDEHGLVDELVVVDADSSDNTAGLARAAGARVVRQSDVLPNAGSLPGKGEALWKGLAATSGDLVVYIDGDIIDIDERFVVGLVGPLLTDETVLFAKAMYDRPITTGPTPGPTGGGRVTELLARPLLATFWPELAWLAQPLSGEYAGRRELFEQLPFVCGYGVELAMLIDIANSVGPAAIAQVDLAQRIHDHQPLEALGRMSTEILQVAVGRLVLEGKIDLSIDLSSQLSQPRRDREGCMVMTDHEITLQERPPLARWRQESA